MTTPSRYTPDHLGEKQVYKSKDGRLNQTIPPAALRYLDVDAGDHIRYHASIDTETGQPTVTLHVIK